MNDSSVSTEIINQVSEIIEKNKSVMPFEIAQQLNISEETAVRALPWHPGKKPRFYAILPPPS